MKIVTKYINLSGILGIIAVLLVVLIVWSWNRDITPFGFIYDFVTDASRVTIEPDPDTHLDIPLTNNGDDSGTEGVVSGYFHDYFPGYLKRLHLDDRILLFFTSVNCTSCQSVKESIINNREDIPAGIYILAVEFTKEPDLRRRYGVTTPHTFVEIRQDYTFIQKWTGSRNLQSILARL